MALDAGSPVDSAAAGHDRLAIVEPDVAEWDAFTQQHRQGHLLQAAGWAELKRSTGWEARRLLVVGPAGPRAGAQLLIQRRLGLSGVYVPRGPLFADDPQANRALLAALERLARGARAVFLRLEPNLLEGDAAAGVLGRLLRGRHFQPARPMMPRSTIQLDLAPDPDQLFARLSKGHRADIKRAAREGVAVRPGSGADLNAFYKIMQETGARAKFAIHSRAYYEAAWAQLAPAGHAQLFLAERAGQALAACLIFAWAGMGLYLYGGSTEPGLRCGANHALQWAAIQWARARGCRSYDFWFVPDQFGQAAATTDSAARARLEVAAAQDPLSGVFRFKKGFGGRVVRYLPAYDRVYLPPLYALWRWRSAGPETTH